MSKSDDFYDAMHILAELKEKRDGAHGKDKVTARTIDAEIFAQALIVASLYIKWIADGHRDAS